MSNKFKKAFNSKEIINAGKAENNSPITNESVNVDVNNDTNVNVDENVNIDVNDDVNKNIFIVPKKEDKGNELKRFTYYFKKKHIKNIESYSKKAGMNKSEFLNNILDKVFDSIEIK